MNKLLFAIMIFAASTGISVAQSASYGDGAKIHFESDVHDYGTIKYDANGLAVLDFENTGNAPLIILDVKSSCKCVVGSYSKEPVQPGNTAAVTVNYDTKRSGSINTSVTVTSNAVNEPTKPLRFKGNVLPKPEGAAPGNNFGAPAY